MQVSKKAVGAPDGARFRPQLEKPMFPTLWGTGKEAGKSETVGYVKECVIRLAEKMQWRFHSLSMLNTVVVSFPSILCCRNA